MIKGKASFEQCQSYRKIELNKDRIGNGSGVKGREEGGDPGTKKGNMGVRECRVPKGGDGFGRE